jgi:hypothetical protein
MSVAWQEGVLGTQHEKSAWCLGVLSQTHYLSLIMSKKLMLGGALKMPGLCW